MDSLVSATAARVVFIDGNAFSLVEADNPRKRIAVPATAVPYLFADAHDLVFLKNTTVTASLIRLQLEWNCDRALRMLDILLDPETPDGEADDAALYFSSLVKERSTEAYVRNRAFATPLGSTNLVDIAAMERRSGAATEFVRELFSARAKIDKVRSAWERVAETNFASEEDRLAFEYSAVNSGSFRALVEALGDDAAMSRAVHECCLNLQSQKNVRVIVEDWIKRLGEGNDNSARPERSKKFLIIDDHALIRDALRSMLKTFRRDAIVLEAGNSGEALRAVEDHTDINLILLDVTLPDRDGLSMLAELRERRPGTPVVVMTSWQDRATIVKVLELGAAGFIPKSARREVVLGALQVVFAGGVYVPPEILASEQVTQAASSGRREHLPTSLGDIGLSPRQQEVLTLMMQGKTNKVIGQTLNLAEPTVKNHVTAIFRALKVSSRAEAIAAVDELGRK